MENVKMKFGLLLLTTIIFINNGFTQEREINWSQGWKFRRVRPLLLIKMFSLILEKTMHKYGKSRCEQQKCSQCLTKSMKIPV